MKKIQTKLTVAMSLLTAALLAFTGTLLIINIAVSYTNDFYDDVTKVLRYDKLPHTVSEDSLYEFMKSESDTLNQNSDKNFYIIKDSNVVKSSYQGGTLTKTKNLDAMLSGKECSRSRIFSPVLDYGINAGDGYCIYITDTHNQLFSQIRTLAFHLVQALLIGVLLAVCISWLIARRLTRSIRALKDGAKRMAEGDFSPVTVTTQDEMASLAKVMNRLGKQIQRDYDEFEKEETRRREFVANVSHELKTPLTVIKSYSQTLASMDVDKETSAQFLAVIDSEVDRMSETVGQLLEISRLEAGKRGEKEVVDLLAVCTDIRQSLLPEIQSKSLDVTLSGEGSITSERSAVYTILSNIISNAVKYTPSGYVAISVCGGKVTVRDSGIGIAKEDIDHLFERFYRADKSRTRQTGGTGLGLAITKQCADSIGAKITVESKLSEFTQFMVEF